MVHGEAWTVKELFVYPNEYIYWTIQIVMYPFLTGLVAGAFVLSSLYHVFGVTKLKEIARFSLVFSFALLPCAPMPLLLHLQQPLRNHHVLMTPHFTSAIAAFGIVFLTYGMIVASELWFVYRGYFVATARELRNKQDRTWSETILMGLYSILIMGAWDVSHHALEQDERAVKVLAAVGIPVACFLHGYAGFIFGSVKANALWMTPLMPVIFICSAVVSGIALCILTYIVTMELRKLIAGRRRQNTYPDDLGGVETQVVRMTSKYLIMFLILAITLELLDLIFRGYTAVKSWDILRSVIYGKDFTAIFILQYGLGNLVPFILFLLPGLTIRRAVVGTLLVLFGVFMMRWNVVIGGQAFSASFAGFMHYHLPIWPHDAETFKEGLFGAMMIGSVPFVLFWMLSRVFPLFEKKELP
ncbi:NrfD/PsrC family molybdoenzyme membrane anchor subunit [Geobacter benzoatilyticus]|uniref:Polysulfide reductase NrfD n=1 Tax=Geobacter benzoatilyticus TaxID=2815309 RepID=A0ABX7Q6K7_9BACT|nr:NrfD/PsrC family molybdoenzyme membrane anchor subunit [Geobacter benzoatilyticus]QSV46675.1 polysulfide reductase NrfD [Geobacter benzoatilyticus]